MSFDVPVLLLTWRRPDTTRQVLDALRAVAPSKLYVSSDGPRNEAEAKAVQLNSLGFGFVSRTVRRHVELGRRHRTQSIQHLTRRVRTAPGEQQHRNIETHLHSTSAPDLLARRSGALVECR